MVVGNTLSEIGDVLIIDTQLSITGSFIQLVSYTDVTLNETLTRLFDKKFRLSQDGLIYTEWSELTNPNVAAVQGNIANNVIYIQYRYERIGADATGILEFVSVNITGNVIPTTCTSPVTDNTIFKGLSCGNFVTAQLCSNLLRKLYSNGIVPEYITRGVVEEDEDYISFWSAVACYMAMFVTFTMKFGNIYMEREYLLEYLKQMNIHFFDRETTLQELQYVASNYLSEIRKRGTKIPFLRKSELLQDGTNPVLDGEILRVLCIDECDEFLWTLKPVERVGWKIGKHSPLFKGTEFDQNLIKGFEKTADCLDLSKYIKFGLSNIDNPNHTNIELSSSTTFKVGLGFEDFANEPLVKNEGVVVDPEYDYEVTFKIKVDSVLNNPRINFRCHAFDCLNNKYSLVRIDDFTDSDTFIDGLKLYKADTFYFVRGIIYAKQHNSIQTIDKHLNTSNGINLKFNSLYVNKIIPYIEVLSDANGDVFSVYDYKIRPLRYSHSSGFINTFNVIEIFAQNHNVKLTMSKIYDIIRRDLIPYNTVLLWNDKLVPKPCINPIEYILEHTDPHIECINPIEYIYEQAVYQSLTIIEMLNKGIIIPNVNKLCCPPCGVYVLCDVDTFLKYAEAIGVVPTTCPLSVFASAETYLKLVEDWPDISLFPTNPDSQQCMAHIPYTGEQLDTLLDVGIVEYGTLAQYITSICWLYENKIISPELLATGFVIQCSEDGTIIASVETYLKYSEAIGLIDPPENPA